MAAESNENKSNKAKKKNQRSRQVYFCIEKSHFFGKEPIHAILNRIKKKYNLPWLRISMCYKKHSNLREIFQSDLNSKLMEDITSQNLLSFNCNCNRRTK